MIMKHPAILLLVTLAFTTVAGLHSPAVAQSFVPANDTVLHVFQGGSSDGKIPAGGVVLDAQGNLYGATSYGGNGGSICFGGSCGTVYQLVPPSTQGGAWTENIIYNFTGKLNNNDGEVPTSGLVIDNAGNLYGVTAYGGTGICLPFGDGCGTVYELSPPSQPGGSWTKTILYSFQGGNDGQLPNGNLIFDRSGNLYGATEFGGGFGTCDAPFYQNCGTIFELSPPTTKGGAWTEKVLYSFKGGPDGANPVGGLVFDKQGAIYGTKQFGGTVYRAGGLEPACQGAAGVGCGTVFRLEPPVTGTGVWSETMLHRFQGNPDGVEPVAGLAIDSKGNLYGTTEGGGTDEGGTVFQLAPPKVPRQSWKEVIIHNFAFGSSIGYQPTGPVVLDGS